MVKFDRSSRRLSTSPLQALLYLVSKVSRHPIEVIVSVFVLVTLAYFVLLRAIANSTLFSSLSDVASLSVISTHVGHSSLPIFEYSPEHVWRSLRDSIESPDQVPDMGFADWLIVVDEHNGPATLQQERRESLLPAITKALQAESHGRCAWPVTRFTDANDTVGDVVVCFEPKSYDASNTRHILSPKTLQRVLAHAMQTLPANTDSDLVERWKRGDILLQSLTPTSHGPKALAGEGISFQWIASFVISALRRAWTLVHRSDTIDFTVLLAAYIMMHGSLVHLYVSMRHFPRRFWLGTCILLSSCFACLVALVTADALQLPINPIVLSEGLPFLVITIGFEKPYLLTKAFFAHATPTLRPDQDTSTLKGSPEDDFVRALTQRVHEEQELGVLTAPFAPVHDVAIRAVAQAGPGILRAYAVEICILMLGAFNGMHGLREFCSLSILILFFDGCLLFTFFLAVLCVTLEVQRIREPNSARKCLLPENDKETPPSEAPAEPQHLDSSKRKRATTSLFRRVFGSLDHPLSRLKLLLLLTLVALHSLNLLSTLSLPTTIARHQSTRPLTLYDDVVSSFDMFNATSSHPAVSAFFDAYTPPKTNAVAFMPPNIIVLADKALATPHSMTASMMTHKMPRNSALDSVMTTWTTVSSDPVIGKLLSVALIISLFLNTFLLKGIATRNPAVIEGNAVYVTAQAAARLIGAHFVEDWKKKPKDEDKSSTPRVSFGPPESRVPPPPPSDPPRSFEQVHEVFKSDGPGALNNEEVVLLVQRGVIAPYALEKVLQDLERAVVIRRAVLSRASEMHTLEHSLLPYKDFDYASVFGACCENVVGYMPLPLGIAGPLIIDGLMTPIPMATTEGTLVASTSRGCKVLNANGGVTTVLTQDAMTRGPVIEFPSLTSAARAKRWIDSAHGASSIKSAFDSTSRFARLASLHTVLAGRTLFVRFATSTGDAMGMNMISKGVEAALGMMKEKHFPEMELLSLSGNYCIDKKPAAINWIEGRGKSVVAEAVIRGDSVRKILKCTVEDLVNLNIKKNLVGSAMAGSIGGFNAHAANILTAMYLATGQDPAQNVESSNCMTLMEAVNHGEDLLVSVSMPSVEVGTVGGGTGLPPQRSMLELLGIQGPHKNTPGANAQRLARIIAAAVMAGELSLMGALCAGHLIKAHMQHNRSAPPTPGHMSPMPKDVQYKPTMTPLIATPIPSTYQQQGLSPVSNTPQDKEAHDT